MRISPKMPRGRARWALLAALVMVVAVPVAVMASHDYDDVPDSHLFHADIEWMAENDVTRGCTAEGEIFCPADPVKRQQMAAFMRRFAGTFGNTGTQVTDFSEAVMIDTTDWVEVLSVEVAAEAEAAVTLDGHVYLERDANSSARYEVKIAPESCEEDPVGVAWWRPGDPAATAVNDPEADTVSLTGNAVTEGATSYVLCVAKFTAGADDATAYMRGLTASWSPTE